MSIDFVGFGSYVPVNMLSNIDLEKFLDTTDEWIRKRTGIIQRFIVNGDLATSYMCMKAAKKALEYAKMDPDDLDAIIVATCTPDKTLPSCANMVQKSLNCKSAFSFDVQGACAGFIYAFAIATNFLKLRQVKNVMVIGADSMSKIVDWSDRNTCILFGDGSGAIIMSLGEGSSDVLSTNLFTDPRLSDALYTDGGIATTQTAGKIIMEGGVVFEHAVKKLSEVILFTLKQNKLSVGDVSYFILHQANIRILDLVAKNLDIDKSKLFITLDKFANTSAASIPISWDCEKKRISTGNIVMLAAMGAGFNWGSALLRV